MIIITSGGYVQPELRTEFGDIPACMLPLANRKLIEHQVRILRAAFAEEPIMVVLPEQYVLTVHEAALLDRLGIHVRRASPGLSPCAALGEILGGEEAGWEHVRLLRGDRLFSEFPEGVDLVSVFPGSDGHAPDRADGGEGADEPSWAGFFAFSSRTSLIRSLRLAGESLADAIRHYGRELPLRSVPVERWCDLGRLDAYFHSRSILTAQRSFNTLNVDADIVTKTGTPPEKIEAEADWYRGVPEHIKKYAPRLISQGSLAGQPYYQLEYLPLSPLNELFVHGRNPVSFWEYAFDLIKDFFVATAGARVDKKSIEKATRRLYADKTRQRLGIFTAAEGIDDARPLYYAGEQLPSLREIREECLDRTLALPCAPGILHGDLCLSNILIDPRAGSIKVIDPRGLDHDNTKTIYGDQKYDLAKLAHSCIGLYDFIISGYYRLEKDDLYHYRLHIDRDERLEAVQDRFWKKRFLPQCAVADVMPLTVLLFLSMLPLHNDSHDKQRALFANALRLYRAYVMR